MPKKLTGVVIGPSGIGKAHIRELIRFGFRNICLVGRNFKQDRLNLFKIEYKNTNFFNLKSITEIKKKQPSIINLCSPTKLHYKQILIIKNFCKYLVIEKPIFWLKDGQSNFKKVKNLLKSKKNKIFVNLPMISLASQIKKKNKIRKIHNFNFNYFTRGKNEFENIPIDLLPHALSFLFTLNTNKIKSFEILKVDKKKNYWNCKLMMNKCLCKFLFKQDPKRKKSLLSFRINQDIFFRKQFIRNNIYINKVIKNNNKLIDLKNPMSDYLNLIFTNLNKNKMLRKNNDIVINSTKIMERLIDY